MKTSSVILRQAAAAMLAVFALTVFAATPSEAAPSRCLAMAGLTPVIEPAAYTPAQASRSEEVEITFVGHSTFRIRSPRDIVIATDFAGYWGKGRIPDVVTMNHAHETHYTDSPDPGIKHVLRGWNPEGGAAQHELSIEDVYIRNVPTNIRHWSGSAEQDGNSIFIFEVGGLCIGHLGHLHHQLTPQHIGWIGRVDVLLVPVDGSYTLSHDSMVQVIRDLQAVIVIPMHYFGPSTLGVFLDRMRQDFEVEVRKEPTMVVSEASLPLKPRVVVLPGF